MSYPPGAPEYGLTDLAADAVGIVDALGVDQAHLVGVSWAGSSPSSSPWTIPSGSPRSR